MEDKKIEQLKNDVFRMREFCTVTGIAEALDIKTEIVQSILDGKDVELDQNEDDKNIILTYKATTKVLPQKVIAVWRTRGKAGATAQAINLARVISSEKMKTLLICMNFAEGGSDLIRYMDLPYFPVDKFTLDRVLPMEENFFVLPPMTRLDRPVTPGEVRDVILAARQQYGAVVLDLPNSQDDSTIAAAVSANTIVWVLGGEGQELERIKAMSARLENKEQVFIANMVRKKDIINALSVDPEKVIEIPYDKLLEESLKKQEPISMKSPFYKGISNLYEQTYRERPEFSDKGKENNILSSFSSAYRRSRKRFEPVFYKVKGLISNVGNILSSVLYVTATLVVITAALVTIDYNKIINIPYIHDIAEIIKQLSNGVK